MTAEEQSFVGQTLQGVTITDPTFKPLPGRVGNLTIPQQHALDKLKKELEEEGKFVPERMDDAMLLRCVFSAWRGACVAEIA